MELEKQLINVCLEVKSKNNFYIEETLAKDCDRRIRFFVGCLANARYPEVLCKLLFNKNFINNVFYIPHSIYTVNFNSLFDGFDAIIYCISNAMEEKTAKKFVKMVNKYFNKSNFEKYSLLSKSEIRNLFEIDSQLNIMVKNAIDICSNEVPKPIYKETAGSLSVFMNPVYRYCDRDREIQFGQKK